MGRGRRWAWRVAELSSCPPARPRYRSFGVVLWELATWEIPWRNVSPWTVVAQLMNGGRLSLPAADSLPGAAADNAAFAHLLPSFFALIKRCWAQNQVRRRGRPTSHAAG